MSWFRTKIRNWIKKEEYAEMQISSVRPEADFQYLNDTVRFTLTPAVGGRILRVTREGNNQKAMNTLGGGSADGQLYVIPSGEDVGARVTKIINLELMK